MKKLQLILVLFSVGVGFAQSKVEAEIDRETIKIGEQIQYKIRVNELEKVIFPKFKSDEAEKAILVLEKPVDTLKNTLEKDYIITYFDSGNYKIPSQTVEINRKKYSVKELSVAVATVEVDTTKQQMFDIKNIIEEPKTFDDYKNLIIYLLLGLIIIAVLIYFLAKKKKTSTEIVKKIPPYVEAIQKFKELDKKEAMAKNNVKKYYSELTDILRVYIEREVSINAMELTTNELIEELFATSKNTDLKIKKETIRTLKSILQNADFVKFAKSTPAVESVQKDRILAEQFIHEINKIIKQQETLKDQ